MIVNVPVLVCETLQDSANATALRQPDETVTTVNAAINAGTGTGTNTVKKAFPDVTETETVSQR